MTENQQALTEVIVRSGIEDPRLIQAFNTVPRDDFVPGQLRGLAYQDQPIPIAHGQVTTQPSLSAMMIDALALEATDRVLEVGTGLGFQTALLAHMAREVVTIEVWDDLAAQARANLGTQAIDNVQIHVGDGSLGVPEAAPYDAILVSAAFTEVPKPLADQLAQGGRLVQPIGRGGNETVTLFRKTGGELVRERSVVPARFVRLVGEEAFPPDTA